MFHLSHGKRVCRKKKIATHLCVVKSFCGYFFCPDTYRMNDALGAGHKRSEENPTHLHGGMC